MGASTGRIIRPTPGRGAAPGFIAPEAVRPAVDQRGNGRDELGRLDGFGEVALKSGVQRPPPVDRARVGSHGDRDR